MTTLNDELEAMREIAAEYRPPMYEIAYCGRCGMGAQVPAVDGWVL